MRELYDCIRWNMHIRQGILLFLGCVSSLSLRAQAPDGYYDGLENLNGDLLKLGLHNLVKDHIQYNYTSTSTDVWDILKEADPDPNNPEDVILFYTGWTKDGEAEYNRGQGWTREHVWAKSHGDFGIDPGAGTDIHALRPADVTVNSARNNKDFDEGGERYIDGDGPTDNFTDSDSWEPRDKVKGDVARSLFYMAVRYEGGGGEPDLELVDSVKSVLSNQEEIGFHGKLSVLLKWHFQDPVDEAELTRNDIVFFYQGNRNPFIDNPQWVSRVWDTTGIGFFSVEDTSSVIPADITDTLNLDSILFSYYKDLETLEGETLKLALHERIQDHTKYPYTSNSNIDVWDLLKETDKDTVNPNNVLLFYTGESVDAAQEFNSGSGWTREHVWPTEHGAFSLSRGPGTDIHHIRPAGNRSSRARGNLDFDKGGEAYIEADSTTGNFVDADSWEPRDAIKGDVARMLFYMATRYEGDEGELDLELVDTVNSVNSTAIDLGFHGKLSTLLEWHASDPVDGYERRRNNVAYIFQRNRNPFIDHPEYVYRIWDPLLYDTTITAYYANLDSSSAGTAFKDQLNALIDSQRVYNYTDNDDTDVWDILKVSDRDPANPENVILFYTGWSVNAAQEFNSGSGWSREDIWSTDHGNLTAYPAARTDVHAIRPADISVNRARDDRDFDEGGTLYIDGDGVTDSYRDEDSWEPRGEVKGDIARMLFYMAVRYEGKAGEPDLELVDEVNTELLTEEGLGFHGKLSTLLRWHEEDPVGRFERNRNQVLFEFQGNRNPFIDHPEFVAKIWDTAQVLGNFPTSSLQSLSSTLLKVFPNPAQQALTMQNLTRHEHEVTFLDIRGKSLKKELLAPHEILSLDVSFWPDGLYFLQVGQVTYKVHIRR